MQPAEFDSSAKTYDQELEKSLSITGEKRDYYARQRIDWTACCVRRQGGSVEKILDFGCGDGASAPLLSAAFKSQVLGVDVSSASIAEARELQAGVELSFQCADEWHPDGSVDLAYTNGVFHHINPLEWKSCLAAVRRSLRSGGLFAFWENNPWNPGTRYVMSHCAFDKNAVMINPREARAILSEVGFKICRTDSLFYFPHGLRSLRPAERWLSALPLGGQYFVLAQNPSS